MDIRTRAWDAALLARFSLTEDMLPRICSNAEVYGHVKEGPLAGVPIAGGAEIQCLPTEGQASLGQAADVAPASQLQGEHP